MHEYSIVQSLIDSCDEHAKKNSAKKVTKVVIKIGVLSGVEPHLLSEAFEAFKKDTICHEANLVINIQKVKEKKLDIFLLDYDGKQLPFQHNAFDRTVSCLVFHHLDTATKQKALAEIFSVLNEEGQLHIADFGRSKSWVQRTLFNLIRGLDGFKSTDANAKGLLPQMISGAGFENVEIKKRFKTMFGEVQIICAAKK